MAYTFLLEDDNSLTTSRKEVIMKREKLVNEVWFLVNPKYNINDMSIFSVTLEYILPVSKSYHTLELTRDIEGYKEYLKYVVPLDTNFSSEDGDVELQLTFVFVGLDAEGNSVQKVRKTKPTKLHITPIAAWSDIIPDEALSAIDQRIIKTQAQIKELEHYTEIMSKNQVDNLAYNSDANTLQLLAGEKEIGDKVTLKPCSSAVDEGGVPVVDFSSLQPNTPVEDESDVVEF